MLKYFSNSCHWILDDKKLLKKRIGEKEKEREREKEEEGKKVRGKHRKGEKREREKMFTGCISDLD